jgi:hypothetical protein
MNPIDAVHLQRSAAIRSDFIAAHPLPRFAVIPDFVRRDLIDDALAGCKRAHYETFCSYSMTEAGTDARSEFREPDEDAYFLMVHKRSRASIPEIARLRQLFKTPETIAALNGLTDAGITRMVEPDVLTYWNPGSFLERHTDDVSDVQFRLVLSVSLTENWQAHYGGATLYAWQDVDRSVRLQPRLNTAVLFVPFAGSYHWVEQVSNDAPPLTRFTWTAFFA